MNNNVRDVLLVFIAVVAVLGLFLGIFYLGNQDDADERAKVAEMVGHGADPIEAACAVGAMSAHADPCKALLYRRAE